MKVYKEFDLTEYNSYKLISKCRNAYFPESEEDVRDLYREKNDYVLLGSGYNVILSKEYYEKDFIIFNGNFEGCRLDCLGGQRIHAEAGATMLQLSEFACDNGLSGLEMFFDIPSSLGGAIVMNAGAGGEEIKDTLVSVRYLDLVDLEFKEILKNEMSFEYRNSFFQKNTDKVVVSAWLQLDRKPVGEIRDKMNRIKGERWRKQPRDYPNAGSVFKRPKGFYVGALIDELDLKGYRIGGAMISTKHGGFIINIDNATGNDIISIITEVRSRVRAKYDIELEVEQRII